MTAKPKRHWFQFSLRTMLVFITLVCTAAGLFAMFTRSRHFQEQAAFHRNQLPQPKDKLRRNSLHRYMESSLKSYNRRSKAEAEYYFAKIRFHQQAADAFDQAARQPWRNPLIPSAPGAPPDEQFDPVAIPQSWTDLEVIMRPDKHAQP
jgi:hypothetical protein